MISHRLFLFIERVVAAKIDIVVQGGSVCLGATGSRAMANDLSDQLTDNIKAEIVEVFVEGEFECQYLAAFLRSERPSTIARLWPEQVLGRETSRDVLSVLPVVSEPRRSRVPILKRPPADAARRAAVAARKRRYQLRLKNGGAVVRVPVKDLAAVIGVLLDLGWLPEDRSENREQIAEAKLANARRC